MPQLEFDGSIAICAARSLPASFGKCWIERTGGECGDEVVAPRRDNSGCRRAGTRRLPRSMHVPRGSTDPLDAGRGNTRVAACQ